MFSLKTRPLIILFIRLKHPIYASKSGQLGYCTSCGNDKLKLLQIRKHFYSFCIRRGGEGGAEGLALKGFRERKKMLRDHPVWSEQDKHVAENIPSTTFNWNQGYVYLFMVCFYKEVNRAKWASLVSRDRRAVHAVPRLCWSPMFECNNVVSVKDLKILATLRSWQLPDLFKYQRKPYIIWETFLKLKSKWSVVPTSQIPIPIFYCYFHLVAIL